jgi:hypothetical protein
MMMDAVDRAALSMKLSTYGSPDRSLHILETNLQDFAKTESALGADLAQLPSDRS